METTLNNQSSLAIMRRFRQPSRKELLTMLPETSESLSTNPNRRRFLAETAALTAAPLFSSLAISSPARAEGPIWRVGVIGQTGRGNYGHSLDTMWRQLPETRIVAVSDGNENGLRNAIARLKNSDGSSPAGYREYREMLAKESPDLVAVCPRAIDEHHEMILAAIRSGAKGIYVEKPFCRSPAEADEIVAACAETDCKIAIAHRNRYHPSLPAIKTLIERGEIGTVLEIRGRGKEDHRGGGLDLWVLGSHVFDLARFFGGDSLSCSANLYQGKRLATQDDVRQGEEGVGRLAGDRLHARFEMSSGIPFYFDSIRNTGRPEAGFGLQIIGTQGIIDIRIDAHPLGHLLPGSPFRPTSDARTWIPISSAGPGKPEPLSDVGPSVAQHRYSARDLIAAIQEKRLPLCNQNDGRAITEMICAVFASHVAGGKSIPLPLTDRRAPLSDWPPKHQR